MATDKLKLYNGALLLVGERPLKDLNEAREPRFLLDAVWDDEAIKACLEAGQWLFATRTVKLEADDDFTPDFGYRYAYQQPEDYVRTCVVSLDEYQFQSLEDYRDEGGFWFMDANIVYISYISQDNDYGMDMSKWPKSFCNYVQAYLASKICPKITNSPTSVKDLEDKMEKELSNAQGKNAINRPPTRFPRGSWSRARNGSFYDRRRSDR